jgi:hypothetical protein
MIFARRLVADSPVYCLKTLPSRFAEGEKKPERLCKPSGFGGERDDGPQDSALLPVVDTTCYCTNRARPGPHPSYGTDEGSVNSSGGLDRKFSKGIKHHPRKVPLSGAV